MGQAMANIITAKEAVELVGKDGPTSLTIAEKFGKRHDDVLKRIRRLDCDEEFRLGNFAESSYVNEQGKTQPMYRVTRDGFAFLAMGFTGKEAAAWKVKFLTAFNLMEKALRREDQLRATKEWAEARASGKAIRLTTTDVIQEFVQYATKQGSTQANRYYCAITQMEHRALFLIDKATGDHLRDRLNVMQLVTLATAENIAQRALREGMESGLPYKEIYQRAKTCVESLAGMVGKSSPGEQLRVRNPQQLTMH